MSSNETKTYALETFHNLGRWLRARWFRLRQPDLAMLADQMANTGVFLDSTVILPNTGSEPVIKWFEERLAYAETSESHLCRVTHVPPDVDIKQRGWTRQTVDLCSWHDRPAAWWNEGAPTVAASIPAEHERLFLSMLYSIPIDNYGSPIPAWGATEGQLSSA